MRHRGIILPPAGLLAVGAAGLLAASAQAATITVSSLNDSGGSGCELREAITSANNDNAAGNGCVNGSGADTINLPAGQIALDTGVGNEPQITSPITIVGQSVTSTGITQSLSGRIFRVGSSGDLTLSSLTVYGGVLADAGGGIINNGVLKLNGVEMGENEVIGDNSANTGGAIFGGMNSSTTISNSVIGAPGHGNIAGSSGGGVSVEYGTLVVINSVFADDQANGTGSNGVGGAIRLVDSNPTPHVHLILNSVFTGNDAARAGGGIFSSLGSTQAAQIERSTFSANTALSGGGALFYGPTTVLNTTFSGNIASSNGGGVTTEDVAGATDVALTNTTLAGNQAPSGSGIELISGGVLTLKSSILDDPAGGGSECDLSGGTLATAGHNLVSDASCGLAGSGDLQSTNPLLGALADNGGPAAGAPGATAVLRTRALLAGSPAIDHAPCAGLAVDERGFPRPSPSAGLCDSGAFELRQPEPPAPPVLVATPPSNAFTFGKLKHNKKKGIAFLFVNLPGPGEVGLQGKGLKTIDLGVSGGAVKLKIAPAKKGKKARKLRRALSHKGKAKVKALVSYVPSGGAADIQVRKLKLLTRR